MKYRSAIGAPLSTQEGRGMGPPKAFIISILTVDEASAAMVLQILWVHACIWRLGLKSKVNFPAPTAASGVFRQGAL